MATGFDTPLGGLALEMAYRNQQAKKKAADQNAYEQSLVNKRLAPYGGDIADYQDVWNRGYGGAMNAAQSQAQALQDYWTGLPELLTAAATEDQRTGGGSSSTSPSGYPQSSTTYDPKALTDYIARMINRLPPALVGNTAANWRAAASGMPRPDAIGTPRRRLR